MSIPSLERNAAINDPGRGSVWHILLVLYFSSTDPIPQRHHPLLAADESHSTNPTISHILHLDLLIHDFNSAYPVAYILSPLATVPPLWKAKVDPLWPAAPVESLQWILVMLKYLGSIWWMFQQWSSLLTFANNTNNNGIVRQLQKTNHPILVNSSSRIVCWSWCE